MRVFVGKFVMRVLNAEVFLIPQIDKTIIASPPIRVNDALKVNSSPYNSLESSLGTIRNNFCIDFIVTFEQAENNGFSTCSTTSNSSNTSCSEVAFIDFNLTFYRRFRFTVSGNSFPESRHIAVNGITVDTRQFCNLRSRQIDRKKLHKLPNFCLRNS